MTDKRALKQAIRRRMDETGEKYTEARRGILGRRAVEHRVFERLTGDARRVVVMAADEARTLRHAYIGTEHILLGRRAHRGTAEVYRGARRGLCPTPAARAGTISAWRATAR